MRPFLRWAGSKVNLLSALEPYWRSNAVRLIEPFAGSAALFFHLAPASAVLADSNAELVSMFRAVRDNPGGVAMHLGRFRPTRREYNRETPTSPTADCDLYAKSLTTSRNGTTVAFTATN